MKILSIPLVSFKRSYYLLAIAILATLFSNKVNAQYTKPRGQLKKELKAALGKISQLDTFHSQLKIAHKRDESRLKQLIEQPTVDEQGLMSALEEYHVHSLQFVDLEKKLKELKGQVGEARLSVNDYDYQLNDLVSRCVTGAKDLDADIASFKYTTQTFEGSLMELLEEKDLMSRYNTAKFKAESSGRTQIIFEEPVPLYKDLDYSSVGIGLGMDYGGVGANMLYKYGRKTGAGVHFTAGGGAGSVMMGGGVKFFFEHRWYVGTSFVRLFGPDGENIMALGVGWDGDLGRKKRLGIRPTLEFVRLLQSAHTFIFPTVGFNYKLKRR